MRSVGAFFQRIGSADKQRFELLHPDINPMHLSRQSGIRQQFVRKLEPVLLKLAILQTQLFDLPLRG